jgi:HK97 family phage major capsid protein
VIEVNDEIKGILARLKQRREKAWNAMKSTLDTAEREQRDFTDSEKRAWEENDQELRTIDARMKELLEAVKREQELEPARAKYAGIIRQPERGADGDYPAARWLLGALEERALVGSGTTGGGAFTPSESAAYFFDLLSARSVALQSGLRVVRTERDSVVVPHMLTDVGAAWTAEAATITNTSLTAEQITATPRKLAAIEQASNEALDDSDPSLVDMVGMSLVRSMALKFDDGVFEGSGTPPEIRGLKNVSGISSVSMGTNGAAFTNLDPFADAIGQLEQDNAEASAIVMHPRSWKALAKLKETTSSTKPVLQDEAGGVGVAPRRSIYGVPVYLTSQLAIDETQGTATNASSAYVYQADQVVAVFRQDTRVERDSSRLFNSDQSEIRAIMRADVVVPNAKAVCRIVGITP